MECPICYDIFNNEIYMCQEGHSVCNVCCKSILWCPMCRKPMSSRRNFTLEAIIAEMQTKECPICAIPTPIKTSELVAHLENHQNKFLICTKSFDYCRTFQKKCTERDFVIVYYDNKLFKFCAEVEEESKIVRFTLQRVNNGVSKDYPFELKYISATKGQSIKIASSPSVEGCSYSFASIAKQEFEQRNTCIFVGVHCFIGEREEINRNYHNVIIS